MALSISIEFKNVIKRYGDVTVIPGLSFKIEKGEFFTLLGPSGCGKTTVLRMVAGFNSIEGGEITFDGEVVNQKPPQKRNIGMVFQDYAVFPHMTVKGNVGFGLANKKMNKKEIEEKVLEMLDIVQIKQFADRLPKNLSGGQQQRVALARAIVMEPNVLLMDEPLSNLDAKLRIDMRNAIREIQKDVGITTLYVTHDQEEAMAISDKIAVMNQGKIEQIGNPQQVYQRPASIFVATFIGRANILRRKVRFENGEHYLYLADNYKIKTPQLAVKESDKEMDVKVSIRPEEFVINTENNDGVDGVIKQSTFLGLNVHYIVTLENGEDVEIIQESTIDGTLEPNTKVKLKVKKEKINIFDDQSELNILRGVTNGL